MKKTIYIALVLCVICPLAFSDVPRQINYQGKVVVQNVPFDDVGYFKFVIVDSTTTNSLWSNDGTSVMGGEPTKGVGVNVHAGIFSIALGDDTRPNMTQLPTEIFENPDLYLRIWFSSDKGNTYILLGQDQRLLSTAYAMHAQTASSLVGGPITGDKLARESVWPEHEGRSNTIVSLYATYSGSDVFEFDFDPSDPEDNDPIPSEKTFVITDIIFGDIDISNIIIGSAASSIYLYYIKDSKITSLFSQTSRELSLSGVGGAIYYTPVTVNFKAGLPVPCGASLYVRHINPNKIGVQTSCTISGFMFKN